MKQILTFVVSTYGARHLWGPNFLRCLSHKLLIYLTLNYLKMMQLFLFRHLLGLTDSRNLKNFRYSTLSFVLWRTSGWWIRWRDWCTHWCYWRAFCSSPAKVCATVITNEAFAWHFRFNNKHDNVLTGIIPQIFQESLWICRKSWPCGAPTCNSWAEQVVGHFNFTISM